MPNPATMNSLQSFDREHINAVIHVPDYKLRRQISLDQKEPLVVEAFSAFDEMFYLHMRWAQDGKYPDFFLTVSATQYQNIVFDLVIQSPYFTHIPSDDAQVSAAPQWSTCNWATSPSPVEVNRTTTTILLYIDRQPTQNNDDTITYDQTMTLTIIGTLWKLDKSPTDSLWCLSYRAKMQDTNEPASEEFLPRMVTNIASMKEMGRLEEDDVADETRAGTADVVIELDDDEHTQHAVHSFILKAHSPVFRRMLSGTMSEASDGHIRMKSVSSQELQDFVSCLYQLCIPSHVQDDEDRLMSILALADKYEVLPVRDECAAVLVNKLTEANMAAVLKVADLHQTAELKTAAVQFICSRPERVVSVMDTDDPSLRRNVREQIQTMKAMPVSLPGEAFSKPGSKPHRPDRPIGTEMRGLLADQTLTV